ncbi:hypothetical protein M9H77_27307 [Catharanthus roseus]|uniref:Uncharacterized protein n=1 Tax=Catharanthus roseus TaxID=4058 RepID=A0ACC0AEA0_CATRO|nr:hypothetical protein M9H77_27307 [Catharanthus roseus]
MKNRVFQFTMDKKGVWKYTTELRTSFPSLTENDVQTSISDEFSMWFREQMEKTVNSSNNECHVDVQDIGSSIVDEDKNNEDEERLNGSPMKEEEELPESDSETSFYTSGSGDVSFPAETSPIETSTPPAAGSIPLGMSPSLAAAYAHLGTSTPPATASTPPTTLIPFPQLSYSSLAPTSTPSTSSAVGMSSRPVPSSSARPPALVP